MERTIMTLLRGWQSSRSRKPLLLRGARQVGKTYVLLELGRTSFPGSVHHVDFESRPQLRALFQDDLTPARIVSELEVALQARIVPGRDLLVLDEIQACPRAITALKYFAAELPDQHVAAAGSLLEFALADKRFSFPVGQVQPAYLFPLSFPEFLAAAGRDVALETVRERPRELGVVAHEALMKLVRTYCRIGGMPAAVQAYVSEGSLLSVERVHAALALTYREDFAKYRPRVEPTCVDLLFSSVARTVGRQVIYTKLTREYTGPTVRAGFDALERAGVIHRVRAVGSPVPPLAASASGRRFKPLFLDVGLLQHAAGLAVDLGSDAGAILDTFAGAVAEQFVGQQLLATGDAFGRAALYYWARAARNSQAEVDFLVEGAGVTHAVEVRRSRVGGMPSVRRFLADHPETAPAYVLSSQPYAVDRRRGAALLPLYYAAALRRLAHEEG